MKVFPMVVFHAVHPYQLVSSQEALDALGPDWRESPAEAALVGAEESPVDPTEASPFIEPEPEPAVEAEPEASLEEVETPALEFEAVPHRTPKKKGR